MVWPLVSVVKQGKAPEIDCLAAGATIAGMSTLDYWIYSIGLVLVTVSVLVA
jgi:hypothetical protein